MELLSQIEHYAFQYYGVDWAVMLTVFIAIFLLDDRRRTGFAVGMISAVFGLLFSFQIGSIANGLASIIVFFLYLRGYLKWEKRARKR